MNPMDLSRALSLFFFLSFTLEIFTLDEIKNNNNNNNNNNKLTNDDGNKLLTNSMMETKTKKNIYIVIDELNKNDSK